jgi:hypothetical protein
VSARHERLYIAVEQSVWASVKKGEAQAFKKVVNLVSESREASANQTRGVRLVIGMDCKRRMQRFEVEDVDGPNKGGADDLDAALAEARGRGE